MPQGQKPKLLIVDDEVDLCGILKYRFRNKGIEVDLAHDEEEGLQKVLEFMPDVVLLDVRLKNSQNGFSLLRTLRSFRHDDYEVQNRIRKLPILVFSAGGALLRGLFEFEGAEAYIEKPYDPAKVQELVLNALDRACSSVG